MAFLVAFEAVITILNPKTKSGLSIFCENCEFTIAQCNISLKAQMKG